MKIYPVILAGGSGTRLWPLSRATLPKQFLSLLTERTMLQETVLRLKNWANLVPPLIVCGTDHRFLVAEQLRQIDVEPSAILLEPFGRNTAPAIAVAASYLLQHESEALMLVLPADHVIDDNEAFEQSVMLAAQAAEMGGLVAFGIPPDRPETGYGYIRQGTSYGDIKGVFSISKFIEKPDINTASSLLESGDYSWNSGMFLFHATAYLGELAIFHSDISIACAAAVRGACQDMMFCRLCEENYRNCPSLSIDYAVMERTKKAAVVMANIGWNDIGSWAALQNPRNTDSNANLLKGDIYIDDVKNSLIRAESRFVAAIGLDGVIVVETQDAILISSKDQAQHVKNVVAYLNENKKQESFTHSRIYRPWGHYETIDEGERFQVKRITVRPGEKLSLQMHHHRAEHWVVVSGTALVTKNGEQTLLTENESIYIPVGSMHRLENPGKLPLHLIEVQTGAYLAEDDIIRFDDMYERT